MKAILFVMVAMSLFATENVLIERYFPKAHPIAILLFMYLPLAIVAGMVYFFGSSAGIVVPRPTDTEIWWIFVAAALFITADLCLFSSYNHGGTAILVTTSTILMPVFASVFRASMHWGYPNRHTYLAWLFGAATLMFAALSHMHDQ